MHQCSARSDYLFRCVCTNDVLPWGDAMDTEKFVSIVSLPLLSVNLIPPLLYPVLGSSSNYWTYLAQKLL